MGFKKLFCVFLCLLLLSPGFGVVSVGTALANNDDGAASENQATGPKVKKPQTAAERKKLQRELRGIAREIGGIESDMEEAERRIKKWTAARKKTDDDLDKVKLRQREVKRALRTEDRKLTKLKREYSKKRGKITANEEAVLRAQISAGEGVVRGLEAANGQLAQDEGRARDKLLQTTRYEKDLRVELNEMAQDRRVLKRRGDAINRALR